MSRQLQLHDQQTSTWWPSGTPAGNISPVARLDGLSTATVGNLLTFDPSDSWDPEGDPLTFTFALIKPSGSSATLQTVGSSRRLSPDRTGRYEVVLTVTDDGGASRGVVSPSPLSDTASIVVNVTAPPSTGGNAGEEEMRSKFGWMVIADTSMEESHAAFEADIGRKVLYTSVNFGHGDRVPPASFANEVGKFITDWGPRLRGPNPVVLCAIIHIFGQAGNTRPAPAQWQQELRNVANGIYDEQWIEQINRLTAAGFRPYLVPRLGHEGDLKHNMSSKIAFITDPSSLNHMQEMEDLYRRALEHVMRLWTERGYRVSYPGNGGWFKELQGNTWLGSTLHDDYVGMKLWQFAQPDPSLYYDFGCDLYINTGRRFPAFMSEVRELVETATTLGKPWSIPEWGVWAETAYTTQEVISGVNQFLDFVATTPAMGDPNNPTPGSCHYFNYFFAGVRQNVPGRTNMEIHWPAAHQAIFVDRLGGEEVVVPGPGPQPEPEPEPQPNTGTFDVIVTTDLGGDPDDIQSLVHLVQNTDVLKVKGIVSTMGVGAAGDPSAIEEWIQRSAPNHLRVRGFDIQSEDELLDAVVTGSRSRGAPSAGRATAGSAHIISTVNGGGYSASNPLWVLVWGAITDVAQALFTDPSIYNKIRIYSIGDYNTNPGDPDSREWMLDFLDTHRTMWWIENGVMPRESRSTFRGVWNGGNQSGEWGAKAFLQQNIRGHGTDHSGLFNQKLGDALPVGDSPAGSVAIGGLKEGDSPSMLYLLSPVWGGVGDVDNPASESWGGRFRRAQSIYPNYWVDLALTPSQCQATINKWRAPASGGYLRHWKARWDRYDLPLAEAPSGAGVQASQADEFVDSIGVNTHWHYTDRVYHSEYAAVRDLLVASGIRNFRDYSMPTKQAVYVELANLGLNMTAVQSIADESGAWRPASAVSLDQTMDTALAVHNAGGLIGLEGVNEPDISSSLDTPTWHAASRDHLADIVAERAARGMTSVPVVGPSITWASNTAALGNITAWTNIGNQHPYAGGATPEAGRARADRDASLTNNVPGGVVWLTEVGYHNDVPSSGTHLGTPEDVAGVYFPRMWLHHWALGIPKSFSYEFIDQGTDGQEFLFGMVRNDLTVKPAYTVTKNLITLLADPGSSFTPGRLDYTVAGGNSATQTVLLQKRDGTFWLAIWQATSMWNPNTRTTSNPTDVTLTVHFGATFDAVRRYQPTSTTPLSTHAGVSSLTFASQERVTLLEIA